MLPLSVQAIKYCRQLCFMKTTWTLLYIHRALLYDVFVFTVLLSVSREELHKRRLLVCVCVCVLKGPEMEADDSLSVLCSPSTDVYLLAKRELFESGSLYLITSDFISFTYQFYH